MAKESQNEYERMLRTFKLEVPEFFNYGFDIVDRWAEEAPNKPALIAVDEKGERVRKYQFSDLKTLSNKLANVLMSLGLKRGDRVIVMLRNIQEI